MDHPHLGGADIPGDLLPRLLPRGRYLCHGELQSLALGAGVVAGITHVPPEATVLADVLVQLQGKAAGSGAGLGVPRGTGAPAAPPAPDPCTGTTQGLPADPNPVGAPTQAWGPIVTSPVAEEELDAGQGHEEQHDEAQQVEPVAPLEGHLCGARTGVRLCGSTPRGTQSAGDPVQPHIMCPAPLTRAARDP